MKNQEVNAQLRLAMCRSCESHLVYTNQLNDLSLYEKVMMIYTCVDCRQSSMLPAKEPNTQTA